MQREVKGVVTEAETGTRLVSAREERALIERVLESLSVPEHDACVQANVLVEGDLRGFPSHGIQRLPVIVERLRNRVTEPVVTPQFRWVTDAVVHVDGGRGLGPVVAFAAIARLREAATKVGVALGLLSDCSHLGMLGLYVEEAADHGHICVALTTSEALVHPWGGARAMIGTNPIAIGLPGRPAPFVLDMATGEVSMGRILEHVHRHESIPLGWAVDSEGRPTADPVAASQGAISPFGGAKGYGLGLAFELLVGMLTGAGLGTGVAGTLDSTSVCNKGDLFLYIDPDAIGLDVTDGRFADYLDQIRTSGGSNGDVRIPGERSQALRARRAVDGIPLPEAVWAEATRLEKELVRS